MKSLRRKMHFVPLGDITETPHISDAPEPHPVIFFTRAQGQNKQIPHQFRRGIFLFWERAWSGEESLAEDSSTQKIQPHSHKSQEALPARQQFLRVPAELQMALKADLFCRKTPSPKSEPCMQLATYSRPDLLVDAYEWSRYTAKSCLAGRAYCQGTKGP